MKVTALIKAYIGQQDAVSKLNQVIMALANDKAKGQEFTQPVRPIWMKGYTGTGKSNLAKVFANALGELGYNYIEVTPGAGKRDIYKMFEKIASVDESGNVSPIPYVIFWDEAHSQPKMVCDVLKALMTKVSENHVIEMQGHYLSFFPTHHIHIFASNNSLDKALARRCSSVELTMYSKGEMKQLANLVLTKKHGINLDDEAMDALLSRCKPLAGDLEEVSASLVTYCRAYDTKKLKGSQVTEIMKSAGFFRLGLRRSDIAILKQLLSGPSTANVLKYEVQDDKKRDTQEKIDWLASIKLVIPVRGGFALSKQGLTYMEELKAAQKAAKSK